MEFDKFFKPKKPTKIDETIHKVLNYEDLDSNYFNKKLFTSLKSRRNKPLTDKLLMEGMIDDEFLFHLNSFDIADLVIMRLESIYDFLDIQKPLNLFVLMKKIEDSIYMYKQQHFENNANNTIISGRIAKNNKRKLNIGKK
jgi:hypothetical protein